jgi:PAS domain S-box-containing protein
MCAPEPSHLEILFEAIPNPVILKDGEGRWLAANKPALRLFELEDVGYMGKTDRELAELTPAFRDTLRQCFDTDQSAWEAGKEVQVEEHAPMPDGSVSVWSVHKIPLFDDAGNRKGLVVVSQDLTPIRRAQEALATAQRENAHRERLAALGELAAVVAHEVRNPLGAIFNSLASLRRAQPAAEGSTALLGVIEEEASRINRIVVELLDFARPYELKLVDTSLEELASAALAGALRTHPTPEKVRVSTRMDPSIPTVKVDSELVELAVMNILVNALQAMPDGGDLQLSVQKVHTSEGHWAQVSVADTGRGIPEKLLARVFEPFFTTRATGTGLGLAIVKRIADGHGARVEVTSAPGQGTTFSLRFPQPA